MKNLRIYSLLFRFLLVFAPTVAWTKNHFNNNQLVLGEVENIIIESRIPIAAKIDSGADQSSLSAKNIRILKRDGRLFVEFTMQDKIRHQEVKFNTPLIGFIRVKKRIEEKENLLRPVIEMKICIGQYHKIIKTNLTNRRHFKYQMLIGRDVLQELKALIDVNQSYLNQPRCQ